MELNNILITIDLHGMVVKYFILLICMYSNCSSRSNRFDVNCDEW